MGGGRKPPPYMVRYFVAPDDSAGARARARRVVAPHAKRLPPSRGKLSSEARLMRVPTGIMGGSSLRPLIRHLLRKCHLPPCGGKALRAATWGRPYGVSGPSIPVGADLRVRPPLPGAHIGAPLHSGAPGRSSSWPGGPQARRGDPHPPQRKADPTGLSAPRNGGVETVT